MTEIRRCAQEATRDASDLLPGNQHSTAVWLICVSEQRDADADECLSCANEEKKIKGFHLSLVCIMCYSVDISRFFNP